VWQVGVRRDEEVMAQEDIYALGEVHRDTLLDGRLITDFEVLRSIREAIAEAAATDRINTMRRMAAAYKANVATKVAALRIEAAYLGWKVRKEVLWNPNTDVGKWWAHKTWARWQAEDNAA
jgi:hypothetical protein